MKEKLIFTHDGETIYGIKKESLVAFFDALQVLHVARDEKWARRQGAVLDMYVERSLKPQLQGPGEVVVLAELYASLDWAQDFFDSAAAKIGVEAPPIFGQVKDELRSQQQAATADWVREVN